MKLLERLDRWHQTKKGLAVFAAVELILAYLFAIWAIDKGNLLDYLLAVVFTVGFLQNAIKLGIKIARERKDKQV
jgi:hypothetical protein